MDKFVAAPHENAIIGSVVGDDRVYAFDATSGDVRRVYCGHARDVNCTVSIPDLRLYATGSADSTIRIWPAAQKPLETRGLLRCELWCAAVHRPPAAGLPGWYCRFYLGRFGFGGSDLRGRRLGGVPATETTASAALRLSTRTAKTTGRKTQERLERNSEARQAPIRPRTPLRAWDARGCGSVGFPCGHWSPVPKRTVARFGG